MDLPVFLDTLFSSNVESVHAEAARHVAVSLEQVAVSHVS
jgi:hypothetical protein